MPAISQNLLSLAVQAFGQALPSDPAQARQAIQTSNLSAMDKATLSQALGDLPAIKNAVAQELQKRQTSQASQKASAMGGKAAGQVQLPYPSKADMQAMAKSFQAAVTKAVGSAGAPASLGDVPAMWEKKDPQSLRIWQNDPKIQEGAAIGANFSIDGTSNWLVDRSLHQNIDLSLWKKAAIQDGLFQSISDEWLGYAEVGTFFLDSGGWNGDDQLDAGRQILGQPNQENKDWQSQHWTMEQREKLAVLVASTSRHALEDRGFHGAEARQKFIEEIGQGSSEIKVLLRERAASALPWLDDPKELRALTDALILLTLADQSRGDAYATAQRGGDVRQSSTYKSEGYVAAYKRGVGQ